MVPHAMNKKINASTLTSVFKRKVNRLTLAKLTQIINRLRVNEVNKILNRLRVNKGNTFHKRVHRRNHGTVIRTLDIYQKLNSSISTKSYNLKIKCRQESPCDQLISGMN